MYFPRHILVFRADSDPVGFNEDSRRIQLTKRSGFMPLWFGIGIIGGLEMLKDPDTALFVAKGAAYVVKSLLYGIHAVSHMGLGVFLHVA
jgi:hypothetical protein